MKNKVLYMILLAGASMFSLASCSDFLDEQSRIEVEKENYMNTAQEAENVLLGVYKTNSTEALYGYHLSILFNMGTDMEQVEGSDNTNYRIIPTNSFPSTQSEVQETWQSLYIGIYRANDFLERISRKMQNYTISDKELATIYIAEARALRAMFYFELVRRFGHVALITSTEMSYQLPSTFVQEDPNKVYEFIEDDLEYAADILPYAIEDVYRKDNKFRFSKGAVLGLLAKVYATWAGYPVYDESKWEKAALAADKLIKSGKHDLLPKFEQLWKNTCNSVWDPTESLIEISFYSPTASSGGDPVGRIGKWNGVKTLDIPGVRGRCAANFKVVHSFVLKWRKEEKDLRRDLSVANYYYDTAKGNGPILWAKGKGDTNEIAQKNDADPLKRQKEKQNYTPAKWDIEKYTESANYIINNDKSNVNWYFLRYADVLLIYAEALNEWKGYPTAEAYAAVNKVRRRGYGTTSSTWDLVQGMNQETFRQAIRTERAYELAFEGHRRQDLIRWGVYYETIQQTYMDLGKWWIMEDGDFNYTVKKYTEKGKHELFPIPQREKDLCTQFNQNPKW